MVIYIDVLFIINLYIAYFQLLAVCVFTHRNISRVRILLSSVLGALFSFAIFLPDDAAVISTVLRITACCVITCSAFGYKSFLTFSKNLLFLLFVNFIFAGLMLALWIFSAPLGMIYANGTVYFDINVITIIITTATAYFLLKFIRYLFDKNGREDEKYSVTIINNGKSCTIGALADTANGLVDCFSGLPVIICRKELCADVSPEVLDLLISGDFENLSDSAKIRIIPFSTITESGYVYAFKADKITINRLCTNKSSDVSAMIGVFPNSRQEYGAIFNPKILL